MTTATIGTIHSEAVLTEARAVTETALDQILLEHVASEKVEKVRGQLGGALQSHTARAWTMGGQVD